MLLVEDNKELRGFLEQTLQENSIDTEAASSVGEAMRLVEAEKFDAIVIDSDLGDSDGITLAGQVRAHKNGRTVPLALMSSVGTALARRMAQTAGCNLFLAKPFGAAQFVEGVRAMH